MFKTLGVVVLVLAIAATVVLVAGCPPKKVPPVAADQAKVKPQPGSSADSSAPPTAPAPADGTAAPADGVAPATPAEGAAPAAPADGAAPAADAAPAAPAAPAPAAGGVTKPDGTPASPPPGG